eukprot:1630107-Prymnesium_polylepis.1
MVAGGERGGTGGCDGEGREGGREGGSTTAGRPSLAQVGTLVCTPSMGVPPPKETINIPSARAMVPTAVPKKPPKGIRILVPESWMLATVVNAPNSSASKSPSDRAHRVPGNAGLGGGGGGSRGRGERGGSGSGGGTRGDQLTGSQYW